jgi:EAL domain-containing protein (putative c-di-GMP-specific phosphodiesterase class I)
VDALKIDRSFVNSLLLPDRPATVESILALARTLNTSVVAEGIESAVQARALQRLGCTHAQGYFFSRPLSAPAIEDLLLADEPLGPRQMPPDAVTVLRNEPEPYLAPAQVEWREELLLQ